MTYFLDYKKFSISNYSCAVSETEHDFFGVLSSKVRDIDFVDLLRI